MRNLFFIIVFLLSFGQSHAQSTYFSHYPSSYFKRHAFEGLNFFRAKMNEKGVGSELIKKDPKNSVIIWKWNQEVDYGKIIIQVIYKVENNKIAVKIMSVDLVVDGVASHILDNKNKNESFNEIFEATKNLYIDVFFESFLKLKPVKL